MAKFDAGHFSKNTGRLMKGAAALVAAAAFAVASLATPAPDLNKPVDELISVPAPVVMSVDEMDEAVVEETSESEEKIRKLGFFTRLKLAFYSFCAAVSAWIAHKIPWKKIFNKRNFYILIAMVCLGLAAYYLLPLVLENQSV